MINERDSDAADIAIGGQNVNIGRLHAIFSHFFEKVDSFHCNQSAKDALFLY